MLCGAAVGNLELRAKNVSGRLRLLAPDSRNAAGERSLNDRWYRDVGLEGQYGVDRDEQLAALGH